MAAVAGARVRQRVREALVAALTTATLHLHVVGGLQGGASGTAAGSLDNTGDKRRAFLVARLVQRKQVALDDLYDLLAVRVIVDKPASCYTVLGIVHNLWLYIPKEFDDYIANPKDNGYQSIHTSVLMPSGDSFEVQIRTQEMHDVAERGIAATRQLAKRQLTWLRGMSTRRVVACDAADAQAQVLSLAEQAAFLVPAR